jgi:hypothetical protein
MSKLKIRFMIIVLKFMRMTLSRNTNLDSDAEYLINDLEEEMDCIEQMENKRR